MGVSALTAEATTIPKEHIMNSATPVGMNKDIKNDYTKIQIRDNHADRRS